MQPKRFSVLSILGNRGSPLSEETTIDRLPIRHHADDEVIIKYLFERLSETAYAFYHLAKPQEVKWNIHLVLRKFAQVKSVFLQRYSSSFHSERKFRTSDLRLSFNNGEQEREIKL